MFKKLFKIDFRVLGGAGAIMLAALFWSLDGVFLRPQFYILPASLVVFLEHFLGFILLSPFLFRYWYKIRMINKKSWWALLWVSVFGGLLGTLMITKAFFLALDGQTTFSTVIVLQKLQPIFALIMARLILKEKLSRRFYIWALIGVVAAYFLVFGRINIFKIDWFHNAAFFALVAAFAFGSSTVFGKRIVNHLDFKITTTLRFAITSILTLSLILFTGDIFKINLVSPLQWKLLLIIVFSSGAVSMFVYYYGLRRVSASTATICELFWPFSAIVLDYVINANVLNFVQIISVVILLFVFYMVIKEGKINGPLLEAQVIWGSGRGRKLGFPTANLDIPDLDISYGVYLVRAYIGDREYQALLHFGYRETFQEEVSAEVFIKDFNQDIYKKKIKIEIISKIREIKKFKNSNELKRQIKKDLQFLH